MQAVRAILKNLRWFISIGAKMMRTHPLATCVAISSMLTSQIAQIFAMLLPLKVILLIGSDGVPSYFPEFLSAYGKNSLIIGLSASAAGFYFLHFLTQSLADWSVTRGASKITATNLKIAIIPNQQARLRTLYTQAAQAASDLCFAAIAFVGITVLKPDFGAAIAGIVFIMAAALVFLAELDRREVSPWHNTDALPGQISTCATLSFFLSFAFILVGYLSTGEINLLVAIISLLVSRQLFQKLSSGSLAVTRLIDSKSLVERLFYHRLPRSNDSPPARTIWSLLDRSSRSTWLTEHLDEILGESVADWTIRWVQTGVPDELTSIATRSGPDESTHLLVKVYTARLEHIATQEATLAEELQNFELIGLKLAGRSDVQGFACLCFEFNDSQYVSNANLPEARRELATRLLTHPLQDSFVNRFRRSRQSLPDRLSSEQIAFMRSAACSDEQRSNLDLFFNALPGMVDRLRSLPVQLITRNLYGRAPLVQSSSGHIVCTHWGNWSIEPVGFAWPIADLANLLTGAASSGLLRKHPEDDLILAALLSELELRCKRRLYADAIPMLPAILKRVHHSAETSHTTADAGSASAG